MIPLPTTGAAESCHILSARLIIQASSSAQVLSHVSQVAYTVTRRAPGWPYVYAWHPVQFLRLGQYHNILQRARHGNSFLSLASTVSPGPCSPDEKHSSARLYALVAAQKPCTTANDSHE